MKPLVPETKTPNPNNAITQPTYDVETFRLLLRTGQLDIHKIQPILLEDNSRITASLVGGAIALKNIQILDMLCKQPGFDPTQPSRSQ